MNLDAIPTPVPTRNHGAARARTDLLAWHCTGDRTVVPARSVAAFLAQPKVQAGYHYLIDRDGSILASTPRDRIAWHAGRSAWPVPVAGVPVGATVNGRSVGVAFVNTCVGVDQPLHEVVTPAQRAAAGELAAALARAYPALRAVAAHVRHRDVAPGRKVDPLPAVLDWEAFRRDLARWLA